MNNGDDARDTALHHSTGQPVEVLPSAHSDRFTRLAKAANAALWEFDFKTGRLTVDPPPHPYLGYTAAELPDHVDAYWRLVDRADREMATAALAAHLEGEAPEFVVRCRIRTRGGGVRWCHTRAVVERDAQGNPQRLHGSTTDDPRLVEQALLRVQAELERHVAERTTALEAVNERLRVEAEERRRVATALRASEERLRSILDNTAAVVYMKDLDGRYLLVNRQFERIFKFDGHSVIGRTDAELLPADTARDLRENDLRIQSTGESFEFEETVPQEDGQEHVYISVKFPLRDAEGRIVAVCGISTDISDRKRAEEALRESEARYRLLAEHSTDIVSRHGPDMATNFVSPACRLVLGYEPEEFRKLSPYDYIHPADLALVMREQATLRPGQETYQMTFRARHRDGHYLWLECHGRAVIDPRTERVREIINHARDITERRAQQERMQTLEDQLAHVNRLSTLGEMASGLAHELNQPLGAISNYAETSLAALATGAIDPEPLRKDMERIVRLTSRCASIIRRLRGYVKRAPSVRAEADLARLVEEVVEFTERELRAAEVALQLSFVERPLWAVVDPIQIQQVVLNLLRNALDATSALPVRERRMEVVGSWANDERFELRVTNTALPITRKHFARVFEPFFTTKEEGLGLGLTISESIARAHGGTLASSIEDNGSISFRLELPRRGDSHVGG
jgi:PAS domain S-box-containing protein